MDLGVLDPFQGVEHVLLGQAGALLAEHQGSSSVRERKKDQNEEEAEKKEEEERKEEEEKKEEEVNVGVRVKIEFETGRGRRMESVPGGPGRRWRAVQEGRQPVPGLGFGRIGGRD